MLEKLSLIKDIISNFNVHDSLLYELLLDIQNIYGYISDPILTLIAEHTNITKNNLLSISSSYPDITLLSNNNNKTIQLCSQFLCNKDNPIKNSSIYTNFNFKDFTITENENLALCFACPAVKINNKIITNLSNLQNITENYINNGFALDHDLSDCIRNLLENIHISTNNYEFYNFLSNRDLFLEFINKVSKIFSHKKCLENEIFANYLHNIKDKYNAKNSILDFIENLFWLETNSIQPRTLVIIASDFIPANFVNNFIIYKFLDFVIPSLQLLTNLFKFSTIKILIRSDFKFLYNLLEKKIRNYFQNYYFNSNYNQNINIQIHRIPTLFIFEDDSALSNFLENKRIEVQNTLESFYLAKNNLYNNAKDINKKIKNSYTIFLKLHDLFSFVNILKSYIDNKNYCFIQPIYISNLHKENSFSEFYIYDCKNNYYKPIHNNYLNNNKYASFLLNKSLFVIPYKESNDEFDTVSLLNIFENQIIRDTINCIIVTDKNICIVRFLSKLSKYFSKQSCGYCVPCRDGLTILSNLLSNVPMLRRKNEYYFTKNMPYSDLISSEKKLFIIEKLLESIYLSSSCIVGHSSGKFLYSIFKHFYIEFEDHYTRHQCNKKVCKI